MGQEALVIGGTGMLADTVLWLVGQGYRVTVLARDRKRFEQLRQDLPDPQAVHFIQLDYHQTAVLKQAMEEWVAETDSVDLVVSWIHSSAPLALETILDALSVQRKPWRLFQVCGSRAWKNPPQEIAREHVLFRRVILGFILEEQSARWLFNHEISQGVIDAIRSDQPLSIVGTVEPWEKRPI
ncbi:short-chain dehydrogenase [Brevibacillus panacihumi W25]|uniref:Short-chain dehydrogenase n=1 Tax=Brevibacillus panacihumi W25 TaxID=1408254 RepID=V6MM15_9BACL|nr:SDR family NAD(P)-dependent oxidoreductase [Brevibacillus panacihumi]EST56528.1 short-chain dehydrogenase [Brevibacillus panacihumi W25]